MPRHLHKSLWKGSLLPLGGVGAVECNEAAILSLSIESKAKDQKIAASGSSYSGSKLPRHRMLLSHRDMPHA
ncbi:hypothetical protein SAMN04490204_3560 [Pseudomonas thivervalensis]|nr:hypothetical protein SAMN04490204_3560 [Pseudomonas thivervalensis]